jgi:dienelactone hydrolase
LAAEFRVCAQQGASRNDVRAKLVVYPGAHHGFYYPHLQPGTSLFGHWLEYNGEAADNATRRLHELLDRHLN